jgi:hypothetical protein
MPLLSFSGSVSKALLFSVLIGESADGKSPAGRISVLSAVILFHPYMPLGGLGHGFMLDKRPDHTAVCIAADQQQYDDNKNNGTCAHDVSSPSFFWFIDIRILLSGVFSLLFFYD